MACSGTVTWYIVETISYGCYETINDPETKYSNAHEKKPTHTHMYAATHTLFKYKYWYSTTIITNAESVELMITKQWEMTHRRWANFRWLLYLSFLSELPLIQCTVRYIIRESKYEIWSSLDVK